MNTDRIRFFNKVEITPTCWLWTASKNKKGYGYFGFEGKVQKAHRVSWILHNGAIPVGLQVLHDCDNPDCVNPKHLLLGTNEDNVRDKQLKGREPIGIYAHSAKLTTSDVLYIRESNKPYRTLAKELSVSCSVISDVKNRKSYQNV